MKILLPLALAAILVTMLGCISMTSVGRDTEFARIIHAASKASPLTVTVDDEVVADAIEYGDIGNYFPISPAEHKIRVTDSKSATALIDTTITVTENQQLSFVLYQDIGSSTVEFLSQEDFNKLTEYSGRFYLRFENLAPTVTPVDFYLLKPGVSVANSTPAASSVDVDKTSSYIDVDANTYGIKVTRAGSKTVVLDAGTFTFSALNTLTFFAFDRRGGGTPIFGKLIIDAPH